MRPTKPWIEHLREQLTTLDEQVGYLSACHDEGPDTFQLGLRDVLAIERQAGADAARRECAGIASNMRPTGGRMWTDEQHACYEALSACATNIEERIGQPISEEIK